MSEQGYIKKNRNIDDIIDQLYASKDSLEILDNVNEITQTYFDRLCDSPKKSRRHVREREWSKEKYTLEKLLDASRYAAAGFVNNDEEMLSFSKWLVAHTEPVFKSKIRDAPTRLSCRVQLNECSRYIAVLEKIIAARGIDYIVFVASGGQPLASLLAFYSGKPVVGLRYSHFTRIDKKVVFPKNAGIRYYENLFKGKKVLIVDDICETGETLKKVDGFLKRLDAGEIYLSASCADPAMYMPDEEEYENLSRSKYYYIFKRK